MAFDYATEILPTVNELLIEFGRSITLLKTPRTPANVAAPWDGPGAWNDASPPANHKFTVNALAIGGDGSNLVSQDAVSSHADVSGGLIRRGARGYLVSGSVAADLTQFDRIDDGGQLWKIDRVNVLKPGPAVLLYGLEVSQ